MTRVLFTGSRHWSPLPLIERILRSLQARHPDGLTIIHGDCATGVDSCVARLCEELGIEQERFSADWAAVDDPEANPVHHWSGRLYDASAGPRRNQRMVATCPAFAIALSPDLRKSRGTADCVRRCMRAGVKTFWASDANQIRRVSVEDI